MRNTFGNNLSVTLFGESHGAAIGAVIDGLPAGIEVDIDYINEKLLLRRPFGKISTSRVEEDCVEILSGVFNSYTTGTSVCIIVKNTNALSDDYSDLKNKPRPGHADFVAEVKYSGFQDYRGGGHFSGRCTVALVAVGAIVENALKKKGISIGTHIKNLNGISDRDFLDLDNDVKELSSKKFAVLSEDAEKAMMQVIARAAADGDSVGGILETVVTGLPSGLGEPWFDSLESVLSHAMFSIPAIKGVEFGLGFGFATLKGSQANDEFTFVDGKVTTKTNNNGGINGGISNGMPVIMRTVVKPTPSIFKEQLTVDLGTGNNVKLNIKGRHDPAIIHRARIVVDMMTAIVLGDFIITAYGGDYLVK